jgi:hypothetical protein
MNRNTGMNAGQIIGTMNGLQVFGLDIAKHVFQEHTVDMGTGEISNIQLRRAGVVEHFTNKPPCLIAMEACGGAHHWARELKKLGHTVRLIHAKAVRPFVAGNKTDATDARAIWLAVQQPGVKFVLTLALRFSDGFGLCAAKLISQLIAKFTFEFFLTSPGKDKVRSLERSDRRYIPSVSHAANMLCRRCGKSELCS